jgi:hypothetical protein
MDIHAQATDFIQQFRKYGPAVEDCFSHGMCYHFAEILRNRFSWNCDIVYDPVANHFAAQIADRIYDITGDITDNSSYSWVSWPKYEDSDELEAKRIYRDCIYKLPEEATICEFCQYMYSPFHNFFTCLYDNSRVYPNHTCAMGCRKI